MYPHEHHDSSRGVYGISVAAELVGTGPQNLRLYERKGLLEPDRTPAGTRRYSPDDLDRLRRISQLLADGLNLDYNDLAARVNRFKSRPKYEPIVIKEELTAAQPRTETLGREKRCRLRARS